MDLPWDPYLEPRYQTIYSSVTKYKYDPILGKNNDWEMMDFIGKGTYEQLYELVHNTVIDGLVNNTSQTIHVGSIGAIDADDRHSYKYYMVK